MHINKEKLQFIFDAKAKMFAYVLMGIGLISMISMFIADGQHHSEHYHLNRAWANVFSGTFFFTAISLGAAFFLGMLYAAEAGWATTIKRVLEATALYLPYGLSLLLIIFILGQLQVHHIYHWMTEGIADPSGPHYDPIITGKIGYFGWFWWLRTVLYIVGWIWFTWQLRKNSLEADKFEYGGDNHSYHWKNVRLGAWFMVVFAVTSSTSAWDWVMSIDTHWFSTLFGWYTFSGLWVSAISFMTLLIIWLRKNDYLEFVTESTIHDMGKWMFAISFLWTYLYFSQFMLIWYANIPEEVTYFQTRWESYKSLMWFVFFINFAFPMLILMSRDSKRNFNLLTLVGTVVFIGHYLDTVMMVMPGIVGKHWTGISWMEIGTFIFFLGLFIFIVLKNLEKAPLLVKNHPFLEESLHLNT